MRLMQWMAVVVLLCGLLFVIEVPGKSQQPSQAPAANASAESEISTRSADAQIKVQVNLVVVRVVVRDAGGKEVGNLKKEDFQVLDNGKPQNISTFSVETAGTREKAAAPAVDARAAGTETTIDAPGTAAEKGIAETEGKTGAADAVKPMPQRFVALVFDDLHMKAAEAMAVHAAAEKLFASLTPTDRVAIYSTSGNATQEFTGDAETLRKTLAAMIPRRGKGEGEYECPNISYYQADLIENKHDPDAITAALLDAKNNNCPLNATDIEANAVRILRTGDQNTREGYQYLDSIVRHLAGMPGQRVLVYVSPGFILGDAVMPANWDVVERAMRAGVVVNAIDAKGLYTADTLPDIAAPPQGAPDKFDSVDYQRMEGIYRVQAQLEQGQVLAGIAASTGGRYFHNRNDLDAAMSQALTAPSVIYVLGFTPQNMKVDGKFHKLKVTVATGEKYQIQARNGYYAPKIVADPEEAAKQEVREALFSQDEIIDVPVELKTQFFKVNETSAQLTVFTRLDTKGIHFRKAEGRSYNNVVLATAVFDNNGQFVDGQMREIALKLQDATVERLGATGLTIKIAFTVKPGTYLVRSVVRGSEGEQMTAKNMTTVIPD